MRAPLVEWVVAPTLGYLLLALLVVALIAGGFYARRQSPRNVERRRLRREREAYRERMAARRDTREP